MSDEKILVEPSEDSDEAGDWLVDALVQRLSREKTFKQRKLEEIFGDEEYNCINIMVNSFMALPGMKEFERLVETKENWNHDHNGEKTQPSYRIFEGEEVLYDGDKTGTINGCPVLVSTTGHGPGEHKFFLYYRKKDKDKIEGAREEIWKRIENFEWFRGKTLHFAGSLNVMDEPKDLSFDDVVLEAGVKESIYDNTVRYLEETEVLAAADLEVRRGLLLSGPPGNGKTLVCKIVSSQVPEGTTTIWVTGSSICRTPDIRNLFAVARSLKPSLLIIEDLDTLGGNRDTNHSTPPVLGELLTQMDGIGGSDGIITIATTNYANKVDSALKDRPRRFDRHFILPPLNEEARYKLLNKLVDGLDDGDLWRAAGRLDGRSGAVVEEVAHTAKVRALRENKKLSKQHLFDSIEELQQNDPENLSSPEII